jgi:DNA mismatch endonuclease (patch repair protein)
MADNHSKETRSYNMSRIPSKNTKPELLVRKFLFSKGFRYRLHDSKIPGMPDIVFSKFRTVIFVHGCFWHGHKNCRHFVLPKSRQEYWIPKIERNASRDALLSDSISGMGWNMITIWECQLKSKCIHETLEILQQRIEEIKCKPQHEHV